MMKRNNTIDSLRGFAIVNMIVYHLLFDLVYMENFKIEWFVNTPGMIWERFICTSFILISGYCFNLSKHKTKQVIRLLIVSSLLSATTFVFANEFFIVFGIIHLICASQILTIALDKLNPNKKTLLILSVAIFALTYRISAHPMNIGTNLFCFLGFYNDKFYSGDYFPLFPWYFMYLIGYCLYDFVDFKLNVQENILSKMGRHSLAIYIIHQPLIIMAIKLIKYLGGF